jgi:hypothetical protein
VTRETEAPADDDTNRRSTHGFEYCVPDGVRVVSEVRGLRVAGSSTVHTPSFPASPSLRSIELPRVLLVASLLYSIDQNP